MTFVTLAWSFYILVGMTFTLYHQGKWAYPNTQWWLAFKASVQDGLAVVLHCDWDAAARRREGASVAGPGLGTHGGHGGHAVSGKHSGAASAAGVADTSELRHRR